MICRDRTFWIQKAQENLGIPREIFLQTQLPPSLRYLQFFTERCGIARGSERFILPDEFVTRAIRQNRTDFVNYAISLGYLNWGLLSLEYARKGEIPTVNQLLQFSGNYQQAAQGEHRELFDAILVAAPQNYSWVWNNLAMAAILSKDIALFNYVRSRAPPNTNWNRVILLDVAIRAGAISVYDFLVPEPNFQTDAANV